MTQIGRTVGRNNTKSSTKTKVRNLIPAYMDAVEEYVAAANAGGEFAMKDYQFAIVMLAAVVLHACDMLEKDGEKILEAVLQSLASYVSDNDYTLAELRNAFEEARESEKNQKMEAKQKYMELMGITSMEFKEMMDANLLSWDEASTVTGTTKRNGTSSTFEDGAEKASPAATTAQRLKDDLYDTGDNEDSLS